MGKNMTDRFCKDCPALDTLDFDSKVCCLKPERLVLRDGKENVWWCYTGRQIMEEEASLQHARDSFGGTYALMKEEEKTDG